MFAPFSITHETIQYRTGRELIENSYLSIHGLSTLAHLRCKLPFEGPVFIHAEEVKYAYSKISRSGAGDRKTSRPGKRRALRSGADGLWTGAPALSSNMLDTFVNLDVRKVSF